MKNHTLFLLPAILLSILFSILLPAELKAGFGVSPGIISEDKLVAGATIERTIYLVQGKPIEDLNIEASVESPDVKDWITIKNGNRFVIPAGMQQYPVNLVIKVPKDADLGIYKAFIQIKTLPKQVEGSQITVALGGKINIELTVGDDLISEFSIKEIDISDIRENDNPQVRVMVINTGNVASGPEAASFELFNKYGNIRLAYGENSNFKKVPPFEEAETTLEFPLDIKLAAGEYWGHVKIYSDGQVIKELRTVFDVTPKSFVEKNTASVIAAAGILALISFVIVWRFFRRRR